MSFFGYRKLFIASFVERQIFVFTVWKIYTILAKHFPFGFIVNYKPHKIFFQACLKSLSFFAFFTLLAARTKSYGLTEPQQGLNKALNGNIEQTLVEPDICKTYAHAICLLCWTMFQLCYVHYCLCINYVTHQTT